MNSDQTAISERPIKFPGFSTNNLDRIATIIMKISLWLFFSFAFSLFQAKATLEIYTLKIWFFSTLVFSYWLIIDIAAGWALQLLNRMKKLIYGLALLPVGVGAALFLFIMWAVLISTVWVSKHGFFISMSFYFSRHPGIFLWVGLLLFLLLRMVSVFSWLYLRKSSGSQQSIVDSNLHTTETLTTQLNGTLYVIQIPDIIRIEAKNYYAEVFATNNTYILRDSLSSLEERLPLDRFFRIHRSHIVQISQVARIKRQSNNSSIAILSNDDELPISRTKLKKFKKMISG